MKRVCKVLVRDRAKLEHEPPIREIDMDRCKLVFYDHEGNRIEILMSRSSGDGIEIRKVEERADDMLQVIPLSSNVIQVK